MTDDEKRTCPFCGARDPRKVIGGIRVPICEHDTGDNFEDRFERSRCLWWSRENTIAATDEAENQAQ